MMTMEPTQRVKRKRIVHTTSAAPADHVAVSEVTSDNVAKGANSPAQKFASQYGMYCLSTVAAMLGRAPITVRRWLRYEECPQPSHSAPFNAYEMMLFDDDDVALLREWADAMRPGTKRITSMRTKRRVPGQPFYREIEQKSRYYGTTKTLRPPKETPIEFWARKQGKEVEEFQYHTGTNVVTLKRIVDPDKRLVEPNVPRRRRRKENRLNAAS